MLWPITTGALRQLNHFIAHRLRQWLWRKHGNPSGKYTALANRELFDTYGLYQLPTNLGVTRTLNDKWNPESRMRENRPSGLMRGGKQTVIGSWPLNPSLPAYSTRQKRHAMRSPAGNPR